ncbi:hypothetical protein SK128_016828 [Halocaridina rubra]|uniref:Uncharacterized protein n=1 Tax=Halocaridina rubra TaxID=373956 RepID=A0AAN8X3N7_HALRR
MDNNAYSPFSFHEDEFMDFMSFPELNEQTDETKTIDTVNPLQNGAQETSVDLQVKTFANVNNAAPVSSDGTEHVSVTALKPRLQILVWSEVKDNTNTNGSSLQEPQPPTQATHFREATDSLPKQERTNTSQVDVPSTPVHIVTGPYTKPRQLAPIPKVPPEDALLPSDVGKKKEFLWQRTEKCDDPEEEKRRLDARKARHHRVMEKEKKQNLQKKLEDAVKERDELREKIQIQEKTGRERKLILLLEKTLQKNKTLEMENKILRHSLSEVLKGNLQLVINKEETAGSTHNVSELVQVPLNPSVLYDCDMPVQISQDVPSVSL